MRNTTALPTRRHQVIPYPAADAHNNGPKDIHGITGILDGSTEPHNGKRAHHTQGKRYIIPDDGHYCTGQGRQYHQRGIKFLAVNGTPNGKY